MLPLKDPCKECLVSMLCEQMCPQVIKFYSKRVRKRSKQEVETATGYYWEDDYTDPDTGITYEGLPSGRISKEKPVKNDPTVLKKLMNFIENLKKGN